ncbi:MAG: cytochrome c3 family protein [Chloroflexi bacterium]|nr:cytochrome c3 family protein [Chloroflexota bacterium]
MLQSLFRARPTRVWLLLGGAATLIGLAALFAAFWIFIQAPRAQAYAAQPLPFEHSKHVQAGVNCFFCHPGATNGPVAGLPSLAKCMGCHVAITPKDAKDQADIDKLIKQWETGRPIRWVKIFEQPDFVRFNHRPHLAQGVACETCHGNVAEMGYAQVYNLNMGFCLNCHRAQSAEKVTRLIDCATCHY